MKPIAVTLRCAICGDRFTKECVRPSLDELTACPGCGRIADLEQFLDPNTRRKLIARVKPLVAKAIGEGSAPQPGD